jgi:hypothetical protein
MNINRITIGIYNGTTSNNLLTKKHGKLFRYHEDLILHHLKKKTNFGGYGYYHTRLFNSQAGDNLVKPSGQILQVHLKSDPIDFDLFTKLDDLEKLNLLFNYLEKSVKIAELKIESDGSEILKAIELSRETGLDLKEKYDNWWSEYHKGSS